MKLLILLTLSMTLFIDFISVRSQCSASLDHISTDQYNWLMPVSDAPNPTNELPATEDENEDPYGLFTGQDNESFGADELVNFNIDADSMSDGFFRMISPLIVSIINHHNYIFYLKSTVKTILIKPPIRFN